MNLIDKFISIKEKLANIDNQIEKYTADVSEMSAKIVNKASSSSFFPEGYDIKPISELQEAQERRSRLLSHMFEYTKEHLTSLAKNLNIKDWQEKVFLYEYLLVKAVNECSTDSQKEAANIAINQINKEIELRKDNSLHEAKLKDAMKIRLLHKLGIIELLHERFAEVNDGRSENQIAKVLVKLDIVRCNPLSVQGLVKEARKGDHSEKVISEDDAFLRELMLLGEN